MPYWTAFVFFPPSCLIILHAYQDAQFTAVAGAMGQALKTYARGDLQQGSMFASKFCWVGFGGWARLTCAFSSIHVAALFKPHPHIAWSQFILKAESFSFSLFSYTPK